MWVLASDWSSESWGKKVVGGEKRSQMWHPLVNGLVAALDQGGGGRGEDLHRGSGLGGSEPASGGKKVGGSLPGAFKVSKENTIGGITERVGPLGGERGWGGKGVKKKVGQAPPSGNRCRKSHQNHLKKGGGSPTLWGGTVRGKTELTRHSWSREGFPTKRRPHKKQSDRKEKKNTNKEDFTGTACTGSSDPWSQRKSTTSAKNKREEKIKGGAEGKGGRKGATCRGGKLKGFVAFRWTKAILAFGEQKKEHSRKKTFTKKKKSSKMKKGGGFMLKKKKA